MKYGLHIGDCMQLSEQLEDNSIALTVTSPPYADTLSYGKEVKTYDEGDYAEWFLPLAKQLYRATTDTGSFILNINDRRIDGARSIYVMDLVCQIVRNTDWTLLDRYIWAKKSGLPMGRTYPNHCCLDDKVEYIFHFIKTRKHFKYNMDDVRVPYMEGTLRRMESAVGLQKAVGDDGISEIIKRRVEPNPLGKIPTTVFDFRTSGTIRGSKHPAAFHPDLPRWFIKWLTDKDDIVLDPFMGSGSTAVASKEENRKWIGFDLNESYAELVQYRVKEAKTKTNLLECFK